MILDLHWNAPGGELATGQQQMADRDHAPAFWSSVARVLKTDPAVAFDLYNEPNGISWPCWRDGCVLHEGWRAACMQMLVDVVAAAGARQPIIPTGLDSCITVACWNSEVKPVTRKVPVVATELGEADCSHAFISRFMNWADSAGCLTWRELESFGCRYPALIRSWDGQPSAYGDGCAPT